MDARAARPGASPRLPTNERRAAMHMHLFSRVLSSTIPAGFAAWPYVDDLFDYTRILGPGKTLAELPPDRRGTEVAIVGAGVAGMVAAYELLRLGLRPVV